MNGREYGELGQVVEMVPGVDDSEGGLGYAEE
jgi:hypothetical protein